MLLTASTAKFVAVVVIVRGSQNFRLEKFWDPITISTTAKFVAVVVIVRTR